VTGITGASPRPRGPARRCVRRPRRGAEGDRTGSRGGRAAATGR